MAFPILAALPVVGKILDKVIGVIDKAVPDKDLAEKLKQEISLTVMGMNHQELMATIAAQRDIIMAEANSESWLTRSWRPITMLGFLFLLFLTWFGIKPEYITESVLVEVFTLLKYGLGGYIVGRSIEKTAQPAIDIVKSLKKKPE